MSAALPRFGLFLLTLVISSCGSSPLRTSHFVNSIDRFPGYEKETDLTRSSPMDESTFRELILEVVNAYQPLAALHNARITLRVPLEAKVSKTCMEATALDAILFCSWSSDFPNADAGRSRQDPAWYIGIGGGLARLPTMTPEGLSLVICHEIGHLFGGFPFLREGFTGLALPVSVEGQADYFASQVCVRKIWAGKDNSRNAQGMLYADMIEDGAVTECQAMYPSVAERDLCYKTVFAGMAFVKTLGKPTHEDSNPSITTPDLNEVDVTSNMHPAAQCRLDTFVAGALCPTAFVAAQNPAAVFYDEAQIPGYHMPSPGGEAARKLSMAFSCREDFQPRAARPRCWFSPEQVQEGGWMNEL